MKTYKIIIIALAVFYLSSCTKDYQKALESIKTELAQTGDTILTYSLDKHFAIWVHIDTANMIETEYGELGASNVYYYDLDKKEKELLFKSGDSLFNKSTNSYVHLYDFDIQITLDSLGLMIYWDKAHWASAGLYPLSKRNTVNTIYGNSLRGLERKDLEITELMGFVTGGLIENKFAAIEIRYNGNGDIIFKSDSAAIYDVNDWTSTPIYKFPKELLGNKDELEKYIISSQVYTIDDVISEAKNGVRFKEYFGNNQKWYKLEVIAIIDFDSDYRVDGENFSFFTNDKAFARLRYPNEIVVRATVSDVRLGQNSIFMGYIDILGGGRRNENADFMFKNCELISYSE